MPHHSDGFSGASSGGRGTFNRGHPPRPFHSELQASHCALGGHFDIILGMDWLSPYHAILDCHAKTMTLSIPGLARLEWRGNPGHYTIRVIYYMKARCMVKKGCLDYLAYVRDSSTEVPTMDLVPVVREFPEVFPADLPGMPPDRDINLCIYLVSGTQPISIPPYCMAPPELKELKEQLQIA
ncbi:uncharacterized protein [Nicotiana tomentosiformis]|uniref:uncharacterized protein n=1 Tax=Nicotiana tomentosiformis TaxID=4098 RepID=UPI00388C9D07